MKYLIHIGKPVHLRLNYHDKNIHLTACGHVGTGVLLSYDTRETECRKCRKTKLYKKMMPKDKTDDLRDALF